MGSIPRLCIPHQGRDGIDPEAVHPSPGMGWDRSRGCASLTGDGIDPKAVHPSLEMGSIPRLCIPHRGWDRSQGCASLTGDGIDPGAVHPSPGMGSIPRLCILHQGWDQSQGCASLARAGRAAQPARGGGSGASPLLGISAPRPRARRGQLGLCWWSSGIAPKGLVGGIFRTQDGAGSWDGAVGTLQCPQGQGPALPQCLSPLPHGSSGGPRRGDTGHGAPAAPREPWGWARARPCPSLPVEGSHSSNTLLRSPTRRGRWLDGPGGGLTGSLAGRELSPRASGSSACSLWIGDPRGRSLSCLEPFLPRVFGKGSFPSYLAGEEPPFPAPSVRDPSPRNRGTARRRLGVVAVEIHPNVIN
ncbi:uncharacterized protein LOC127463863 isoform X2 [Manacus candei]|uniref:uncharacterized protein LOC127463863 isoform X2 n=1 Tax=Manacus candei TaxID=415023 RepID=UPI002227D517|nr:uncharacterized protein LOC127463863 isoform X2 [Manacus candei]